MFYPARRCSVRVPNLRVPTTTGGLLQSDRTLRFCLLTIILVGRFLSPSKSSVLGRSYHGRWNRTAICRQSLRLVRAVQVRISSWPCSCSLRSRRPHSAWSHGSYIAAWGIANASRSSDFCL